MERRAYMFVDEFLDAVFDDVFQRLALLDRERVGLQHILRSSQQTRREPHPRSDTHQQIRQAIEHGHGLVPQRAQALLLRRRVGAHLHGGVDRGVEDAREPGRALGRALVAEQRGRVHGHDLAQDLRVVEQRGWRGHLWVVEVLGSRAGQQMICAWGDERGELD